MSKEVLKPWQNATWLIDVFIHASDVENYCMAASEAVCCGCIIVSTQVGELLTISMSNNLNA